MDEWGTVAFAPLMFSAASYLTDPTQTEPIFPFALEEGSGKKDTKPDPVNFAKLYDDYNTAQGTSAFAQRTATQTKAAGGVNADAIAGAVNGTKLDLFRTNAQRALAVDDLRKKEADLVRQAATSNVNTARTAAESASSTLTAAQFRQSSAIAEVSAAQNKLATAQAAKAGSAVLDGLQAAVFKAQAEKTKADSVVSTAQSQKTDATSNLAAAEDKLTKAEKSFQDALNAPLAQPATKDNPALPTLEAPLADLGTTGIGSLRGAGATVENAGDGVLPAPLSTEAGSFSPLARINSAASALAVKNILAFLGKPEAALAFQDKRILFAVTSLSVNPGWRTKQEFKAVIDAQVANALEPAHDGTIQEILRNTDYPLGFRKRVYQDYRESATEAQRKFFDNPEIEALSSQAFQQLAGELPGHDADRSVIVSAVTPMVDSQNLDLASSIARQDEIALFLAGTMAQAGGVATGKLFTTWAKLRRKDTATRTTLAVANSHTWGNAFGFEIGTRLRGLDDDAARGNKAAQTLERQTFPVLVILGFSAEDALPRFTLTGQGRRQRVFVQEPHLQVAYSTRWARVSHSFWTHFRPERRLSEGYRETLALGTTRDRLRHDFQDAPPYDLESEPVLQDSIEATIQNMKREYGSLVKNLYGNEYHTALPAKWMFSTAASDASLSNPEAKICQIDFFPPELNFTETQKVATVVLRGEHLDLVDVTRVAVVSQGLRKTAVGVRKLDDTSLTLEVELVGTESGEARFVLPLGKQNESFTTQPLSFVLRNPGPPTLVDWPTSSLHLPGNLQEGFWTGSLELLLRGTGLNQLAPTAVLRGRGLDPLNGQEISVGVEPRGDQAALLTMELRSKTGRGEAFVELTSTESPNRKLLSFPFQFEFQTAVPAALEAFGPAEFLGTNRDTTGKFTGTFLLPLSGTGLSRLHEATFQGSSGGTGTAKIQSQSENSAIVEISIAGAPSDRGTAFLEFTLQGSPDGVKLYSTPFKYRLIPPAK